MARLSTPAPRAALIASHAYGTPPPPASPPAPGASDDNQGASADQFQPAPYHADPDETVQCPACQRMNDDDASFCDQCGFQLKGADDVIVTTPGAAAPTPPAAAQTAAAPPAPAQGAVDEQGNVNGAVRCANPDCGHLASAHLNDDTLGANTGACSMTDCACLGMALAAQPNTGTGDGGGQNVGGAEPSSGSQELAHATIPVAPGLPASDGSDLNAPPAVQGGENVGAAFSIPVLVIEGQPTGDGRQIGCALSWRIPPLPLMGLATSPHDPAGMSPNDPAVVCGRIDSLARSAGEGSTQIISAQGVYLANDDGAYFSELNEQFGRLAISADVATQEWDITAGEIDENGWPTDLTETVTEGIVMGATVMPGFSAFEGAYIVLGDGEALPEAIPQQAEGLAAAGVHWMTYEQCERCDQGLEVLRAAGGPIAPPRAWFEDPNFTPGDGRLVEILDRAGAGQMACPLTVTDEGRVYGHLAPWNVCHIGKPGCVTAPHSASDYAYFKRGQHVVCADGSKVRVGTLTVDAGHADIRSSPSSAMAHYDNIAMGAADVACGEDEYGIWIAGATRPSASAEQVRALRASSISGDWRGLGGSLELVAALAVPVPGFPHAVVAGAGHEALLAAGTSVMHALKHPSAPPAESVESYLPALRRLARRDARERLSALQR